MKIKKTSPAILIATAIISLCSFNIRAQSKSNTTRWIQPDAAKGQKTWGIHNGIAFGIWPNGVENGDNGDGGPRGLLRVGREVNGKFYLVNFIAVEPIVNGRIEFSEISPSTVDDRWGKLFWTSDDRAADAYNPNLAKGVISHPDTAKPEVEQLTLYLFMEQFLHKANPYLKISIRTDKPDEICLEIFNKPNSAKMDRCALTATMGNYSRLRQLHLKGEVIDSRKLYSDHKGIEFVENQTYPADKFHRTADGSLIAIATSNEPLNKLASWPKTKAYADRAGWRYRIPAKLTQYWRKDATGYDPSLELRVNGRAKYWAVASKNANDYIDIPGGPAFENFELREKYYSGQKFYFGITTKSAEELLK